MKVFVLALVLFSVLNSFAAVHGLFNGNNIRSNSTMEVLGLQVGNISTVPAYTLEVGGSTEITGLAVVTNSLEVTGNIIGSSTVTGATIESTGAATFNSAAGDFDFTVKSDTATPLFVDGTGPGYVGIGTCLAPTHELCVNGTVEITGGFVLVIPNFTPSSSTDTKGVTGEITWDNTHTYRCIGYGSWTRWTTEITTW